MVVRLLLEIVVILVLFSRIEDTPKVDDNDTDEGIGRFAK